MNLEDILVNGIDNGQLEIMLGLGERLIDAIIANEPLDRLKNLIDSGAPLWYQNSGEGISPLHAAAYSQNSQLAAILLEHGAIWNATDNLKNTAGDISLSLNDPLTYTLIRDAGIRTELLLSMISPKSTSQPSSLILRETNSTAVGCTDTFLNTSLTFMKDKQGQDICLLKVGDEEVGVMMGWESGIMEETVRKLCEGHPRTQNMKVLNIGFGLGIIDNFFQNLSPVHHVIVEAHPDVLRHMKKQGWYEKPGVEILEGKWQDFLDHNVIRAGGFDVVYTDTFSEDYSDLRRFFEHLPHLLAGPESRFSFFNGLGATNALFSDVFTHIAELHLANLGMDVQWFDVGVTSTTGTKDRWSGSQKYFDLPIYRLPVGSMRQSRK